MTVRRLGYGSPGVKSRFALNCDLNLPEDNYSHGLRRRVAEEVVNNSFEFYKIWIGYCHRHCLKRFLEALEEYRKQNKCTQKRLSELYKKFKAVLKTSTSKVNLESKIKLLDDEELLDPILKARLDVLKANAVYYTLNKQRKGIAQTTSLVDNYLKIVKRKLRQVESFRDKEWAALFFKAQANTRNFVPFNPGAKNAGKSPFALAGGQTFDLPWIHVMNVHNAFLFTEGAL